ncbi:hypothetical protein SISNIDRAFT_449704 [Sistotremastrum niveocremeum HHB9708]|uniref:Uncharacterized protein n=2 Tax=Sistotremastraceae TaxID=3402574 RepID=A0A164ZU87_9AGAM|nr:hypothetical protein SISNIDRAFT_449704 [Sistotremastrum niveocremeum HHB9708]KZT38313.1 hypothetical protein SISSUDRAFT_1047121 [Sistotremastrum suecicum HHB10207 ss-3]
MADNTGPATPISTLRNRTAASPPGAFPAATVESAQSSATMSPSRHTLSSSTLDSRSGTPNQGDHFSRTLPARRILINADPSIVSVFDPNDTELYSLWSPAR